MNKPHWMQPGCGVPVLAAAAPRARNPRAARGRRRRGGCGWQGAVRNKHAARSAAAGISGIGSPAVSLSQATTSRLARAPLPLRGANPGGLV
jgi:hypothetical protein